MAARQFMKSHLTASDSDVSQHARIQEERVECDCRSEEGRHRRTRPAACGKSVEFCLYGQKGQNSPMILHISSH